MPSVSRRFVLTGAALTSASLLVPIAARPARAQRSDDADYEITDWILIAANGQVTLGLSQPEVGQGSYTALPLHLAGVSSRATGLPIRRNRFRSFNGGAALSGSLAASDASVP